jgi:hypothetical protein
VPDFLQKGAADLKKMPKTPVFRRQLVAKFEGGSDTAEFLPQLVAEIPWSHNWRIPL